ncbi:MAG: hypothetical protein M0Z62_02935, partial [Actinomycetota bacterium]|nr:hypothetical protein [Actinomycetota bacterium]
YRALSFWLPLPTGWGAWGVIALGERRERRELRELRGEAAAGGSDGLPADDVEGGGPASDLGSLPA